MEDIPVQVLMPTAASAPDSEYDAAAGAACSAWRLDDEACFHVAVPDTYAAGHDVFVVIDEMGGSASRNHGWQITVTLGRPSAGGPAMPAAQETASVAFRSSPVPGQLTRRVIKASGATAPGCVGGQALMAGDLLGIVLRRAPAVEDEDPFPVRVLAIHVRMLLNQTRISGCPGRLGMIVDSVRDLFNETSPGFVSDEFILRSMNRCLRELAQANYWRRESRVTAAGGVGEMDLLEMIPDLHDVHQVRPHPSGDPLEPVGSFRRFLDLPPAAQHGGAPRFYCVQNNTLHIWPASPDGGCVLLVYHSYLPGELACANDPPDPPVPRGHDAVFAYFVLREAFLRDRHAPDANMKVQQYGGLYEEAKDALLGEGDPPALRLRPAR